MSDAKDVFISFTHIDDEPLYEGQQGWIAEFHRHLQARLNKLWGRESAVWRDPSLHGNDLLMPALERQLETVRTLVSVISPRYVRSDWCQKEMAAFLRAAEKSGGLRVGDQVRWFKVLKTPINKDDLPPEFPQQLLTYFDNLLGYAFFDVDPQSKRPREYSREFGPEAERLYHAKVYDLAWDLCGLLKKLESIPKPPAAGTEAKKTVYLATTTGDLQCERDQIRRELLERGHIVLGDAPLPWAAGDLRAAVRAALMQSDISVHLMGSMYGFVPEGATDSVIGLQAEVAAEVARERQLRRMIKVPRDLAGLEERQAAYLRRLREDEKTMAGVELLDGTLVQLKELLIDWLKPPAPAAPVEKRATATATTQAPLIYLIGEPADSDSMDVVDDYLYEKGFEVTRASKNASESELAEAHRRRLVECDAALIYYGTSSREWVDMKLIDLAQARGYGRAKEYRAKAVCVAPPDDRNKQRFRTRAVDVLPFDGSHPLVLEPFVEQLKAAN